MDHDQLQRYFTCKCVRGREAHVGPDDLRRVLSNLLTDAITRNKVNDLLIRIRDQLLITKATWERSTTRGKLNHYLVTWGVRDVTKETEYHRWCREILDESSDAFLRVMCSLRVTLYFFHLLEELVSVPLDYKQYCKSPYIFEYYINAAMCRSKNSRIMDYSLFFPPNILPQLPIIQNPDFKQGRYKIVCHNMKYELVAILD